MNIRTKLTLQFTLIVSAIIIILSFTVYFSASSYRKLVAYHRMENRATTYARLLFDFKKFDTQTITFIDRNTSKSLENEHIIIFDEELNILFKNYEGKRVELTTNILAELYIKNKSFFDIDNMEGIAFTQNFDNKKYYIACMAYDFYGLRWFYNLKTVLIITSLASIFLTIIGGYYFSKKALSPISKIVKQVENINVEKLDTRLQTGNSHDEIAQLAKTFNNMLRRLEDSFEIQNHFVSNASHELRTPLTSLTSEIEVTLLKERTINEYIGTLQSLYEEIKSLNRLSNGLLDLAQSSVDLTLLKVSKIRVDELLLSARAELLSHHNEFLINIDFESLPPEETNLIVYGNENLLKTAFINLFENACKFSENNKCKVIIITDKNSYIIKVSDNGIGIPPDEIDKVWEAFYRAKNSREKEGHGVGLHLVKKIVEIHKGNISIQSAENIGTEITIALPC